MSEIVKQWWTLEMREQDDDPGHWYSVGGEFKSLGDVVWYRDNCWMPLQKNRRKPERRIMRHTHTKELEAQ